MGDAPYKRGERTQLYKTINKLVREWAQDMPEVKAKPRDCTILIDTIFDAYDSYYEEITAEMTAFVMRNH